MSTQEPDDNNFEADQDDESSMRAMPEDKLGAGGATRRQRKSGFPVKPVLVVVVVIGALAFMFYPGGEQELPAPAPESVQAPMPATPPRPAAEDIPDRPDTPVEVAEETPGEVAPEPVEPPLPEPQDSDPLMREELQSVGAAGELQGFNEGEHLLERMVALVDGGSRGVLLRKILPMSAPDEPFPVEKVDGRIYMDQAGYERYDSYVDAVLALDTATIVDSFHRLRPLYEKAYAQLGLPGEDLDNALIASLDRIIATPEVAGPLELKRDSVMYSYADPQLEEMSPLQKQLLRMGPDNTRRLKEKAQQIRAALLSP
ncbi:DUF3014 domain-containing protein [Parahaliea aestuarii]|uniref:DUF3014 domain-containing protein n=1 Tax=Parahaliea aestuarii TaxID=1852021 RepID=A0A5C9A6B0_9GAMM|nr:DUF3014 domain-containing protein [Parahaliea aestuarii]TXS94711.1 DUF3014 domain-containing protein [Parahaliea aestuarii]